MCACVLSRACELRGVSSCSLTLEARQRAAARRRRVEHIDAARLGERAADEERFRARLRKWWTDGRVDGWTGGRTDRPQGEGCI